MHPAAERRELADNIDRLMARPVAGMPTLPVTVTSEAALSERDAEGAHARMDYHERECAIRYEGIQEAVERLQDGIGELKDDIKSWRALFVKVGWWLVTTLVTVVIALVGFLGTQLWDARQPAYPVAIEAGP